MNYRWMTLVILFLAGCTPAASSTSVSPEPSPVILPTHEPDSPAPNTMEETMTGLAIADLSHRLSIDRSTVHLLSTESTTWPDSSLGCPQPGGLYTRILIKGYLIRLEANDQIFNYHTDTKSQVLLCEEVSLPSFPVTPGEIDDGQPWVPVD